MKGYFNNRKNQPFSRGSDCRGVKNINGAEINHK